MSSLFRLNDGMDPARDFLGEGWQADPQSRIYLPKNSPEFTLSSVILVKRNDFDAKRHTSLCCYAWQEIWNLGEKLLLPIFGDKTGFFEGSEILSPKGERFFLNIFGLQGRICRFFAPKESIHRNQSHMVVFDKEATY